MPFQNKNKINGYVPATQKIVPQDIPKTHYPQEWDALANAIFRDVYEIEKVSILNFQKENVEPDSSWSNASWKKVVNKENALLLAIQINGFIPSAHLRELLVRVKRIFHNQQDTNLYFTVAFVKEGSRSMKRLYPTSISMKHALRSSIGIYNRQKEERWAA